MPTLFSDYKRTSSADKIARYQEEAKDAYAGPEGVFQLKVKDKVTEHAEVKMQFLPSQHNDNPFIRCYSYSKKMNGKFIFEDSPQINGDFCPFADLKKRLRESGHDTEAKSLPRRTTYAVNVLIVSDSNTPENNGKVLLYRMPKSLFDKVEFELECGRDPFDISNARRFTLVSHKPTGAQFRTYEHSSFDQQPTPLNDAEAEALYVQTRDLNDVIDVKPYDTIQAKLEEVCFELFNMAGPAPPPPNNDNVITEEERNTNVIEEEGWFDEEEGGAT